MSNGTSIPISLERVAAVCGGALIGDPNITVLKPASLDKATSNCLTFLVNSNKLKESHGFKPGVILLRPVDRDLFDCPRILVEDPYLAYAKVSKLFVADIPVASVHPSAVVDPTVSIGSGVVINANVVIGPDCQIGDNVMIGAQTVLDSNCIVGAESEIDASVCLYSNCRIGLRCKISSGVVLGASGFGYAPDGDSWEKIHHHGGVQIGDDVDIGANTAIDRGTLEDTVIGNRVKLDNMIHIAHNVRVGNDTIIAGCVGIAGSTDIGKRCKIGGKAGVIGHLKITDDVVIHAMALVTKSIDSPGEYSSMIPAQPAKQLTKALAQLNRLDNLIAKIKNGGNK